MTVKKFSGKTIYSGSAVGKVMVLRDHQEPIRRTKVEDAKREIRRVCHAIKESGQHQHFYADGKYNILLYNAEGLFRNPNCLHDFRRLIGHDHHVRRFDRRIGTQTAHGHADIGPCQHRCIVNTVTDKNQSAFF